jgi:hypothetical protein
MKWKEDQGELGLLKPWLAAEKGNANHDAVHSTSDSLIGPVILTF